MKTKRIAMICLCLIAGMLTTLAQRTDMTINSGWYFHKGGIGIADRNFEGENWERIDLPHSWNVKDAFDETPGYYRGEGWYAHELYAPEIWKGQRIILHFEGANQVAEVYVNEERVGKHIGGYTAFNFDITQYLRFGEKNILKVRMDNRHDKNIPPLNADFTFYGGIYRNVRLVVVNPVHFNITRDAADGVFVKTDRVDEKSASVSVSGEVVNNTDKAGRFVVECVIRDEQGTLVTRKSEEIQIKPGTEASFRIGSLIVNRPRLWSPESPYLYHAEVAVYKRGEKVCEDRTVLPLGLRWFEFNGQEGFKLNGRKYELKGANRHQDFAGKGNALTDEYHVNDYTRIKSLGFNFVRLAHYPQSQEVYRTCDRLGLLVWTEIPVVNEVTPTPEFTENSLNMMREQIHQTSNHPSVILYGYMNEILIKMLSNKKLSEEQRREKAAQTRELALKLEALTKAEAPDRNTVMAIHYENGYNQYEVSTITDVLGYNLYFGWYYENVEDLTRFLNSEHEKYPNRSIIISEYGADADVRNHSLTPRSWDFSTEYQMIVHSSYLAQMKALPYLAGYTLWNFADFGAENRADAIPWINQKGIVNYDRTDKDVVGLYQAAQLADPVVYIAARNYTRRKAEETTLQSGVCVNPVTVFSNGKEITLSLNGRPLGKKEVADHQACFDVPFVNGRNELLAVDDRGVKDRLEIDQVVLSADASKLGDEELAVNVGSYQTFINPITQTVWIPDRVYTKGSWGRQGGTIYEKMNRQLKVGIFNNILGTDCNPLYQTFVEGIESYRFDVKDGVYRVTLCFVENNPKSPTADIVYNLSDAEADKAPAGVREFDISANGNKLISRLNLARDYGNLQAVSIDVTVEARNNSGIELDFTPVFGKTTLSGIRIKKIAD